MVDEGGIGAKKTTARNVGQTVQNIRLPATVTTYDPSEIAHCNYITTESSDVQTKQYVC
jgi:hypothetical protein